MKRFIIFLILGSILILIDIVFPIAGKVFLYFLSGWALMDISIDL